MSGSRGESQPTPHGVVEYFGANGEGYTCGYCKAMKTPGSLDWGMWAHRLRPSEYQMLIDRGWRRSGKYCYKAILNKTCCPPYTIKCESLAFKPTKSQKKALKKVHRFLAYGEKGKDCPADNNGLRSTALASTDRPMELDAREPKMSDAPVVSIEGKGEDKEMKASVAGADVGGDAVRGPSSAKVTPAYPRPEEKGKKAKQIRVERKLAKIMKNKNCDESEARVLMKNKSEEKQKRIEKRIKPLKAYFNEKISEKPAHFLNIRFVSNSDNEYQETLEASHKVYQKYQNAVHGDAIEKCTLKQYKRFLVDTPLLSESFGREEETTGGGSEKLPSRYGSYHMQYWLDGEKLIAVGVLDILPLSISSVYLYYDPEYSFLGLGTYSALREIDLTQHLQSFNSHLKYYYMGFYIHSCPKMIYKGRFRPSLLLCPEAYTWQPIEKCAPKLDKCKYQRLEEDQNKADEDKSGISDRDILVLFRNQGLSFAQYKQMAPGRDLDDDADVEEYAKLVGAKCCRSMLLYRS